MKAHKKIVVEQTAKIRGHVAQLVDRSWSMNHRKEEAEQGVAEFAKKQASLDGVKVTMSLFQFNAPDVGKAGYEKCWGPVKAKDAPEYILEPDGNTALYDAIGRCIRDTEKDIAELKHRADKVVVAIMTDGYENSSKEFSFEAITELIGSKQKQGWEFLFMAGTLQSVEFGHRSGLHTMGYNPAAKGQTASVYATASAATADYFVGATNTIEVPDTVDADAGSE